MENHELDIERRQLSQARRNDEVSDAARRQSQGRIADAPPAGSRDRVSYSDPVADGIDPTDPDSPENNFQR